MSRFFTRLVLGVLVVLVLASAVGLTMPQTWRVERQILVDAPAPRVFALVNDLGRWPEWTSWNAAADPSLRRTFTAPRTAGVGAGMAWTGDEMGEGRVTIAESVPERLVRYDLQLEHESFMARGAIALAPAQDGVQVTWTSEGDLGMNPLVRLMGPWIEHAVGTDSDQGLAGLKRVAEGRRS
jgi:hypothetical protein